MTRCRFIAVFLLLASVASEANGQLFRRFERSSPRPTASSGRYCSSPYCAMCNRLFGLMPGYASVNGKITYVGRQTKTTTEIPKLPAIDSTPQPIVDIMLVLANLTEDDVLLDPGCGDGRFLIKSVQRYGCKAIGVEIDAKTADIAEAAIREAGVGKQVLVVRGDATKHQLGIATAVTLYLYPDTIKAMSPNWPNARIVISYMHPIPGVENRKLNLAIEGQEHTIFFWTKVLSESSAVRSN